jgi:hypothetical protein
MNSINGFLLIVFLALSFACNDKCNTDKKKEKIIGNWAYYYAEEYGELYVVNDHTFYSKSEIRRLGSANYNIVGDSIWFGNNSYEIIFINCDHMVLFSPPPFSDTIKYDKLSVIESTDNHLAFLIRRYNYLMNRSIITPDSALRCFYYLYTNKDIEIEEEEIPINR